MTLFRREKAEGYIRSIPPPLTDSDEMKWGEVALQAKCVDVGLFKVNLKYLFNITCLLICHDRFVPFVTLCFFFAFVLSLF